MNSTYEICLNGAKLAESAFYRWVLGIKLLSCIFGIIGTFYLINIEGIRWLVHPNAKIVYAVHLFWATYVPMAFMVPMGYDFIRFLIVHSDPCDYILSLSNGFWIRFVGALGNITQSYTMLAFALERSVATIWPVKYEMVKCSLVGWILGIGAVVLSFLHIFILLVIPNDKFEGYCFATSILTKKNKDNYTIHLSIMMYLEITTVTIFTINLIINKMQRIRLKIGAIGYTYQIKETRKLIMALLPCFWIHFIFFLTPTVVISWRRKPPLDTIGDIEWIEILSNYQLYSIILPIIIFFLRRSDRRRVVVNSHHGMDNHFEQLSAMFR